MSDTASPRLLADRMLGKLARLLRAAGHDVECVGDDDVSAIGERARREGRVLLTRNAKLAATLPASEAVFVGDPHPFHQARQLIRDLGLHLDGAFTRCVVDNCVLSPIERDAVRERLPPRVLAAHEVFLHCERCGRVYWEGSHARAMREMLRALENVPFVRHHDEDLDEADAGILEPVVDLHQAIALLFLRHRLALMKLDVASATRLASRFALCLRRHADDETAFVLPTYERSAPREGFERGAAPEIFRADHEKMFRHLDDIARDLDLLARVDDEEALPARCLALIDREKILVTLLEHHDHRERVHLYPAVARMLTHEEQVDLVERMLGIPVGTLD